MLNNFLRIIELLLPIDFAALYQQLINLILIVERTLTLIVFDSSEYINCEARHLFDQSRYSQHIVQVLAFYQV